MVRQLLRGSFLRILALALVGVLALSASAQMKQPDMVTLSGTMIDLTCAAKGQAMMNNWYNAENNDHKTPKGPKEKCATMCLEGGQPAALFADNEIKAVFACNPRHTLADYAAQNVEVQGFWAVEGSVNTFVPAKIRSGSGSWNDVNCDIMHQ